MMKALLALTLVGLFAACTGAPASRELVPPSREPVPPPSPAAADAESAPRDPEDGGVTRGVAAGRPRVAEIGFLVTARTGGAERALPPDATLRTGDRLAFTVTSAESAYVYLLQFFANGTSAVLFPEEGEANQVAGKLRIPPSGWFQLDEEVGDEHFYLIASTRPLSDADRAVKRTVDQIRISGSNSPPEEKGGGGGNGEPNDHGKRPVNRPAPAGSNASGSRDHEVDPPPVGLRLETRGVFRVSDEGAPSITLQTDERGVVIYRFSVTHAPLI